jgi:PEP-CTERM motif
MRNIVALFALVIAVSLRAFGAAKLLHTHPPKECVVPEPGTFIMLASVAALFGAAWLCRYILNARKFRVERRRGL